MNPVSVTYVGNYPGPWAGDLSSPAVRHPTSTHDVVSRDTEPTTDAELLALFWQHVENKIEELKGDVESDALDRVHTLALLYALTGAKGDTAATIVGCTMTMWLAAKKDNNCCDLHNYFEFVCGGLCMGVNQVVRIMRRPSGIPRPLSEKAAQRTVLTWYGSRCVLTDTNRPDGAHIVPVRLMSSGRLETIARCLGNIWPACEFTDIGQGGQEEKNVLPMAPGPHRRWDRYEFYLRAVAHPTDPHNRLYLTFFWTGMTPGREAFCDAINSRRHQDGQDNGYDENEPVFPIKNGDTFLLQTTDANVYPLPSLRLLHIQEGAYRLMGGMKAAAALEGMFGGRLHDEDDDNDDSPGIQGQDGEGRDEDLDIDDLDGNELDGMLQFLLDEAVDAHVLDKAGAARWARTLLREQKYVLDGNCAV